MENNNPQPLKQDTPPVNQEITTSVSQQPQPEARKADNRLLKVLIITIAVFLVVSFFGFWAYYRSWEYQRGIVKKPESTISADRRTYRNEKFGFVLGLPESWADFELSERKMDSPEYNCRLPFDSVEFKITRSQDDDREYYFTLRIYIYSHEWWAARRLGQQIGRQFLNCGWTILPYFEENKDYVFSWNLNSNMLHMEKFPREEVAENVLQLRKEEVEGIMATFEIINPVKKTAGWKSYFNPRGCKDIKEDDFTNECYLESLKVITGVKMCRKVRPDYQDFCYFQVAQNLEVPSICENLSFLLNKETCYQNVAISSKNASICSKIKTEIPRDVCYTEIAVALKDILICEEIQSGMKNSCYSLLNPVQPELPIPSISEWKTYANEKHKYSFKHPPKWEFKVTQTNPDTSELFVIRETINNQTETSIWRWDIEIDTWDNPYLSLIDWLKFRREPGALLPEDMPLLANTFVGEEKVEALQLWQGGNSTWDKPGECGQVCPYLEVYFVHQDKGYRATLRGRGKVDQESQKIFKQILSTFKFIK